MAPVARPLAKWPDLLCGPILRRVTKKSVAVFVAFKSACNVELSVGQQGKPGPRQAVSQPTHGLGQNLHVCVVELWLSAQQPDFSPNVIYEYELRFQPSGSSEWKSLKDLGVLAGAAPLGYEPNALPTFSVCPGLKDLNIVYGSCRKAHGPGPDALALVDPLIRASRRSALARPHLLLLGGDQIYADDVPLALLRTLTATASTLLEGWSHLEKIPLTTSTGTVDWASPQVSPGPSRAAFVTGETQLTTKENEGHLLFLGEFYAQYLFAWSDSLWPRSEDGTPTLPAVADFPHLLRQSFDSLQRVKFADAREQALSFARSLPIVRRVLANVPTLMIFDDHEVTDDWFIDARWEGRVRQHAPTLQIIRNGLLAYAIFQDWGNHPENYDMGALGRTLLDYVSYSAGFDPRILRDPSLCDILLDVRPNSLPSEENERMLWDFHVEGPEHVVIGLDTRTWRAGHRTEAKGRAALISSESMKRQIDQRRTAIPNKLPVIVSATPVIGHTIVEGVQEKVVEDEWFNWLRRPVETIDFESWGGNRRTFEEFLALVAKFGRAVILSGDVHYAFSNHIAYFPDGTPTPTPSRIVQLCSSAFKNQGVGTEFLGALAYAGLKKTEWLGFNDDLVGPDRTDLLVAIDAGLSYSNTDYAIDDFANNAIARRRQELFISGRLDKPAVIPSGGWTKSRAVDVVRRLADDPITHGSRTNWRYTVNYISDGRTVDERAAAAGLQAVFSWARDHLMRTIASDVARIVVGVNNVGAVQFETDSTGSVTGLVHRLYWQPRSIDGNSGPPMFTEMKAPLTTPVTAERPTVSL